CGCAIPRGTIVETVAPNGGQTNRVPAAGPPGTVSHQPTRETAPQNRLPSFRPSRQPPKPGADAATAGPVPLDVVSIVEAIGQKVPAISNPPAIRQPGPATG